jgi:hypothetical protein
MKFCEEARIVVVVLLAALSPVAFSQATNTFPTSGDVGIGTTSPTATLGVQGAYDANASSTTSVPEMTLSNGGAISLWMSNYAYSGTWLQSIQQYQGADYFKNLYLQPLGGNVGIGTTGPWGTLDVRGMYDPNAPSISVSP